MYNTITVPNVVFSPHRLVFGSICNTMLNTIQYVILSFHSIKCETLFWGRLSFVTVSIRSCTITKYTADHHCNSIAASITNTDSCNKCNVYDNIFGNRCNNNDWSYPDNGSKYSTIVFTVLLLWSFLGNGAKYVSRLFIY